jgi:hypothetical protein
MFPPVRTRTRAALLRAMDRAIEFATLGEYGLEVPGADAPAPGTGRSARSVGRRPGAVASAGSPARRVEVAQRARCVRAATPAGRLAAMPAPDPATRGALAPPPHPAARVAAPDAAVTRVPSPRVRQRGGSVPPAAPTCVQA